MTRNITFSADESVIVQAREKARREHRTLNDVFREWLAQYSGTGNRATLSEFRNRWKDVKIGGPYSREDMNARR
jgi:hypothetical protein